jgi:hypothetical protein
MSCLIVTNWWPSAIALVLHFYILFFFHFLLYVLFSFCHDKYKSFLQEVPNDNVNCERWMLCERWRNGERTVNRERFVNGEQTVNERWTNTLWTVNERWTNGERTLCERWTNAERTVNERYVNGERTENERWTNAMWTVNERWTNGKMLKYIYGSHSILPQPTLGAMPLKSLLLYCIRISTDFTCNK